MRRHVDVDQRLAARDRNDRRAALIDRGQAFLDGEPFAQDLVGIRDLPAARALEVALEQRLEHEHERIARLAAQLLVQDVTANSVLLMKGYAHGSKPLRVRS